MYRCAAGTQVVQGCFPNAKPEPSPAHYLWAVLIARIYEVFQLLYPLCGRGVH